jgi:hypothetical protein
MEGAPVRIAVIRAVFRGEWEVGEPNDLDLDVLEAVPAP